MKEKYDRSKMSAEELAKTQVLNLSDVEKLANYEKKVSKKPAIVLGVIGLFVLSIGMFYPKVTAFLAKDKDEGVIYNRVDDKIDDAVNNNDNTTTSNQVNLNSQLTCTKTTLAAPDGTDTTLTYNLSFIDNALQSYTKLAIINPNSTNPAGVATVDGLYNGFLSFSQVPVNGYYLQVTKNSSGIAVNVNIDLTKLDVMSFPETHKTNSVSNVEFNLNATKDVVSNMLATGGFNCR